MKKLVLKLCGIFILVFVMTFISLNLFSNNKQVKATETITTPSIEILKNNVSYSDSIYILYAVACEGFETNKNDVSLLFWESSQESYLKGTEAYVSSARGKVTIDGKKCLTFYSKGLAAKNMTDDLIAIAYVVVDGVEYYSEPMKFSVLEYVYKMKDSGTLNPHQQRLLERMLSYGGAAQDNFDYNTDKKADSTYYRIELINGVHTDGFNHGLFQKDQVLTISANTPEEGYKFSHWEDSKGNIVSDKAICEITVKEENETYEAIYKPIETIILKDNLEIDEPFDATAATLSLPDFVTINNAEDVEETIEVSWDTTTFVPNQIGEQIIYGSLVNSDYQLEKPLSIKVNVFPYTFTLDETNSTYAINKYYGTSEEEIVPATFKGLPINTIKTKAFNEVLTLTELEIPTTITTIEQGAIYLCDNLENISIPFFGNTPVDQWGNGGGVFGLIFGASSYNDQAAYIPTNLKNVVLLDGITSIPSYAFYHCSGIQSVKLPSTLTKIGGAAFYECQLLSEITLPSEVSNINSSAFENCISLQNVYFEGSLEKWCNISFGSAESNPMNYANNFHLKDSEGVYQVVTEIEIPNTILEIGNYQFVGFKNLSKVTFPSTLVAIKEAAFKNCISLPSVTLPESLGLVDNSAFELCTMLAEVEILSTRLTEIGNNAFAGCIFEEFDIPSTLQYLGEGSFNGCINLKEVTLPVGITEIKNNTFLNCMNLVSVKADGIIVSIGSNAFYSCVNLKSVEVKEGLISVGYMAFYECENLSNFTFPTTLSSIDGWAFLGCESITNVTLTNNITRIEDLTFHGCSNLETVILPETLEYLGSNAFYGCSKLTNIDIPSGIQVIKSGTFSGCESLGNVVIPDGVTIIETYAFAYCESFTSIVIPEGVTKICSDAFIDCKNLSTVVLPSTLETLEYRAFGYTGVENIELPESLTMIGEDTFICTKLTEIEIPSGITIIPKNCFHSCSELTTVKLPESVKTIGENAFNECRKLASINLENVESIGTDAFYYCESLESIILSENLQEIGEGAFSWCNNLAIIYNLSDLELTKGSTEYGSVAFNAKYIHNELPREISLEKEVAYGTTTDTLELPETVTFTYNEEEVTLAVTWDTTSFVEGEFGEQFIYGVFSDDELYDKYNILRGKIKFIVNVLPYEFELNEETNEYAITKYHGNSDEEVIPESFNDLPVSSLNEKAFENVATLKRLTIPNTIKTIAKSAVYNCTSLEYIAIPFVGGSISANQYFGYIFGGTSLIPETLKDVEILEGVTTIPSSAFSTCENIVNIYFPESVTRVNSYAFEECSSLLNVYYNGTIETWCKIDFLDEDATPMRYGNHFFMKDENNEWQEITTITVPSSITKINRFQFMGFAYVTEFNLPSTLTYIGNYSFRNCKSITSIEIPLSVATVTNHAFFNCTKLTTVYFENNIKTIGDYAFLSCKKLTDVYYTGTSAEWNKVSIGLSNFDSKTIHYEYVKEA